MLKKFIAISVCFILILVPTIAMAAGNLNYSKEKQIREHVTSLLSGDIEPTIEDSTISCVEDIVSIEEPRNFTNNNEDGVTITDNDTALDVIQLEDGSYLATALVSNEYELTNSNGIGGASTFSNTALHEKTFSDVTVALSINYNTYHYEHGAIYADYAKANTYYIAYQRTGDPQMYCSKLALEGQYWGRMYDNAHNWLTTVGVTTSATRTVTSPTKGTTYSKAANQTYYSEIPTGEVKGILNFTVKRRNSDYSGNSVLVMNISDIL